MVQTLTGCTDFGVPVGTYFGDGIKRALTPQAECVVRGRITQFPQAHGIATLLPASIF